MQRNSGHNILGLIKKNKVECKLQFAMFMTFYFRLSSSELYVSPEKVQDMMDIIEA